MKMRYRSTAVALTFALSLGVSASVAVADEGRSHETRESSRDEGEGEDRPEFEVEIDRPLVMLGDEVVIEAKYKVKVEGVEEDPEDDVDDESNLEDDDENLRMSDETSGATTASDGLPTSVAFSVDYGDGTVADLGVDEVTSDEEEFEAETEGDAYVYAAVDSYTVTVTATPDVGPTQTRTLDVTVTTDPVAYGRGIDRACPKGSEVLAAPGDPDGFGSFKDVAGSAHARAIECLAARGVVAGRTATDFAPRAAVTREQAASLLSRLLADAGVDLPRHPEDPFGDDEGSVHEPAVNQLAELGVIGGVGIGEFAPKASLSRGQMTTLLVRLYQVAVGSELTSELDYFVDDDGSVHETSVNASAAAGIALGRGHEVFGGGEKVTREQLATFLARLLDLLVEEGQVAS